MTRRRFLVDCAECCSFAGPFGSLAEAELLAGTHDHLVHRGRPTALVLAEDEPGPAVAATA